MSLEEAIVESTAAMKALTAVMSGKGGAVTATAETGKRSPGRPKKITLDDVKAIAEKVRDEKDRPTAVKLIKKFDADSLAEINESKYAAFIAAAEVLLNGGGDEDEDESNADL